MSFSGHQQTELKKTITNDGFYPDLELGVFQKKYRLPAEYSPELLEEGLEFAIIEINSDLEQARRRWDADGKSGLDDNQQKIYIRAVSNRAKAYLLQEYKTITAKPAANNEPKEADDTYQLFLKFSGQAVRLLQKRGRIGVALL